jgi:dienelactone hydrolase
LSGGRAERRLAGNSCGAHIAAASFTKRILEACMNFRRFIPVLFLIFVANFSGVDRVRAEPGQVSVADSPFPEIQGVQWIKLEGSKGHKFLTGILRPEGPGPFPVVVVLHGGDGLSREYVSVAKDVAIAGFLVVVGCWQHGEMGSRVCSEATPESEWAADPAANSGKELIAFARTLPDARADRIGLYGMSRGGYAALWAASTGAGVQAVVVDAPAHAPDVHHVPPKPLEVLAGLATPVLMMHGTADKEIPVEQSREYEKAARDLGKPLVAVYFEGIGHMPSVRFESHAEARQRAIAFLGDQLFK